MCELVFCARKIFLQCSIPSELGDDNISMVLTHVHRCRKFANYSANQ